MVLWGAAVVVARVVVVPVGVVAAVVVVAVLEVAEVGPDVVLGATVLPSVGLQSE